MTTNDTQALPPIEHDAEMNRAYIPMPGGWEVQTQGKGSSFRICDTKTGLRWIITDKMAHKAIEQMARAVHADALASRQDQQGQAVIAYATTNEDGDPSMLFFDRTEALGYCADDQEPIALVAAPSLPVGKEPTP